jgi:hypothetical protein
MEKVLIITKTDIPFFRAGYGNLNIFFIAILVFIAVNIIEHFRIFISGSIAFIILFIYFLYIYLSCVSKITFFKDKLRITTTISTKNIELIRVKNIKISSLRLSSSITLKFRLKDIFFPFSCNFIVMDKTSFGNFKDTLESIEEIFSYYNIPFERNS